jgi:hypothetical protein
MSVWCLWYCTDTDQSGRIFGMHVVAVGSSDSLVFTDGQLKLRSRSDYGFETPRPRMPVGRLFTASPRAHLVSYSIDDANFFLRVKRTGRETENSPPSSPEVKNVWNNTFTPPIRLPVVHIQIYLYL